MAVHHVALATRDMKATHEFYTGPMGFRLAKVEVGPAGGENGWAKHIFYETGDTGDGLIAFWELNDDTLAEDWSPAIATGLGLPLWTNHLAFTSTDMDDLEIHKQRWLGFGLDVIDIDHDWCHSIYVTDPNGILVEFCTSIRAFTDADREDALRLLADPSPKVGPPPRTVVHRGKRD